MIIWLLLWVVELFMCAILCVGLWTVIILEFEITILENIVVWGIEN